jgi:hypothetical protein
MKKLKPGMLPAAIGLCLGLLASPATASDQGWLNNSATFSISPKWKLKLTQEMRALEITYADPYLHNLQAGVVRTLPKNFYLAVLYKREHVAVNDVGVDENRYTLEGGWKKRITPDLDFDFRIKTEIRRFSDQEKNHMRFRFRARLKYSMVLGGLKLKPFIATETFGKDKFYTVQKNRLYLGSIIPLSDHVELVFNYIWLNQRDQEDIHIFNSGVDLKF